jgi:hypothetical protein
VRRELASILDSKPGALAQYLEEQWGDGQLGWAQLALTIGGSCVNFRIK